MRIGIFSDIHGNVAGLERALDLLEEQHVDTLICAGDVINEYRFSNDAVRIVRETGAYLIHGNHEETFFGPYGARARSDPKIDPELMAWLEDQPDELRLDLGNRKFYVVHGSPWPPYKEYLYEHHPKIQLFRDVGADFVVLGHTHARMLVRAGDTLVINPGSVGEARTPNEGKHLSCAVVETDTTEVTFLTYHV